MGEFYREFKRREFARILNKITGISIDESRTKHGLIKCTINGKSETLPRHTTITKKEVEEIGKYLLNKIQKEELREHFKFLK